MMRTKKYLMILVAMVTFISCDYIFPETESLSEKDLGEIHIENFITIGDGYLAGVMDGALYSEGQKNSVAALIASQLNNIEQINFVQPSVNSENGYNLYVPSETGVKGKWIYKFLNSNDEKATRTVTSGENIGAFSGNKNELNNLSLPQLRVSQLAGSGIEENLFFERTFSESNTNIIEQVVQKSPTFLICWIGINDYLKYAMNGATNSEELTGVESFETNFGLLLEEIIQNTDAKIVLGNLISIEDLPFFYTNQYNFIRLTNPQKGNAQSRYSSYNAGVAAYNVGKPYAETRKMISFEDNGATLYPQPVVVLDETMPDATYPDGSPLEKYRQLEEGEMALFSFSEEMVENGMGWMNPVSNSYYLSLNQLNEIKNRYNSFQNTILSLALHYPERVVVADISSAVKQIANTGKIDSWGIPVSGEPIYENGVPLEGGLDLNSIFSLDAIHFNQRGNAFIANEFIKTINNNFGAHVPETKINEKIGNLYFFSE